MMSQIPRTLVLVAALFGAAAVSAVPYVFIYQWSDVTLQDFSVVPSVSLTFTGDTVNAVEDATFVRFHHTAGSVAVAGTGTFEILFADGYRSDFSKSGTSDFLSDSMSNLIASGFHAPSTPLTTWDFASPIGPAPLFSAINPTGPTPPWALILTAAGGVALNSQIIGGTFTARFPTASVPDRGSPLVLASLAMAGLLAARRRRVRWEGKI